MYGGTDILLVDFYIFRQNAHIYQISTFLYPKNLQHQQLLYFSAY